MVASGLAHLAHHDQHWEFCWDYERRLEHIKKNKPVDEIPTRLNWFKIVPDDKIPFKDSPKWEAYLKAKEACLKAKEAYFKAGEAYLKAGGAYLKAKEAYFKARVAYLKAKEAYLKAEEAYLKAKEAYLKADRAYDKAGGAYLRLADEALDELHKELFPDCPFDGKTMFPMKEA